MMYSHYYLVLTLVSIIGLALPSDHGSSVMTQRKIAKKNSPTSTNIAGMVTNLQNNPHVTITNKTPYDTYGHYGNNGVFYRTGLFCSADYIEVIASGGTWTASSRGGCLVTRIYTALILPDLPDGYVTCADYQSSGTSDSIYSILMKGDDACCVLSSHQTPQTCP